MANTKVAIIVGDFFEEAEFTIPKEALEQAGFEVTVISASGQELQSVNHVDKSKTYSADMLLDEAEQDLYKAVLFPGGAINADHLRMNETAREWLRNFLQSDRLIGMICHAPWLLVSSGEARGRTLTSYYTIQDDIKNAGGEWKDEEVVEDSNLITSRQPDDMPAFSERFVQLLQEQEESK